MFNEKIPPFKIPDNSKAGITVCLNQKENDEPFEATVYFKKSGKSPDDLRKEDGIILTASGKLRLDIGMNSFVEIFAERSNKLKDIEAEDGAAALQEESDGTMSIL
jgi:hypothetical protein